MTFGVCGGADLDPLLRRAGYDYRETTVAGLLRPREDRAAFRAGLAAAAGPEALPCPVVNCFVPADLKITGPAADPAALEAYAATVFARAAEAGVEVVVFGSGGARRVPEGYDRAAAWGQLVAFARMCGRQAADHGVTVAVEPLNRSECNVLTTVRAGAELVGEADHPAVRLLVDAFHLLKDGDRLEDVAAFGGLLVHAHVATVPGRLAPGAEPCDLAPFFAALRRAGYRGRVSIEGGLPAPETDLPRALAELRALAGGPAAGGNPETTGR